MPAKRTKSATVELDQSAQPVRPVKGHDEQRAAALATGGNRNKNKANVGQRDPVPPPHTKANAGRSVRYWLNAMSEWTYDGIAAVADDAGAPAAKRMAAMSLCRALCDKTLQSGRPLASEELDRVMDRTLGKPSQALEIQTTSKTLAIVSLNRGQLDALDGVVQFDDDIDGDDAPALPSVASGDTYGDGDGDDNP